MKHDLIKNGFEYIGNRLSPYPNPQKPNFKERLLNTLKKSFEKILELILEELIARGINELFNQLF